MIFGLEGLSNVGMVAPGIYRGAQPRSEGYPTLKNIGIKTVINLRSKHTEKTAVEKAGMKSIEIPLDCLRALDVETVNKIVGMMVTPANQPVFVHCGLGEDRTGIVIAAYRIRVEKWPLSEAKAEMQSFGFNDVWQHFKKFLREYAQSSGK